MSAALSTAPLFHAAFLALYREPANANVDPAAIGDAVRDVLRSAGADRLTLEDVIASAADRLYDGPTAFPPSPETV
jgi:hypothetical protein